MSIVPVYFDHNATTPLDEQVLSAMLLYMRREFGNASSRHEYGRRARQDAKIENRAIRDGEVKTACQQACPTDAIVFGNLNDPASRVAQLKAEPADYGLLADLNTRPRTTYLAAIRNPNPELAPARMHEAHGEAPHGGLPRAPEAGPIERNSMEHP